MDASACEKVEAVREKMAATALDDTAPRSEQIAAAAALANLTDAQTRRMEVSARLAPLLTPAGAETAAQPAAPAEPEKKTWLEKIEDKLTPAAAPAIAA